MRDSNYENYLLFQTEFMERVNANFPIGKTIILRTNFQIIFEIGISDVRIYLE